MLFRDAYASLSRSSFLIRLKFAAKKYVSCIIGASDAKRETDEILTDLWPHDTHETLSLEDQRRFGKQMVEGKHEIT